LAQVEEIDIEKKNAVKGELLLQHSLAMFLISKIE
jgi:hypothetical protein